MSNDYESWGPYLKNSNKDGGDLQILFSLFLAVRDMDDNLSCLSIPGTRRTVYLSGNESVDAEDTSAAMSVNVSNFVVTPPPDPSVNSPYLYFFEREIYEIVWCDEVNCFIRCFSKMNISFQGQEEFNKISAAENARSSTPHQDLRY